MVINDDIAPPDEPWALFADWYALAEAHETAYPNAMTLATVGAAGAPSARVVLMKGWDKEGIVFHTNRDSRKGHELAANAKAAVCFYWKALERQIRIEGDVAPVSESASDAYFATRPRASQIGAWASRQSQKVENRAELERRVAEMEKKYAGRDVPRPPHWGGYLLTPSLFEFWQERPYRLHDRVVYHRNATGWAIERLFP